MQSTIQRHRWYRYVSQQRPCPESVRRVMVTQLVVLLLLSVVVVWLRGMGTFENLFLGVLSGLLCEKLAVRLRGGADPGDTAHGMMMGLLAVLTLPVGCKWYVAVVAALTAVVLGKYLFGGMGNYIWHPALVGWLIAELFFRGKGVVVMGAGGLAGMTGVATAHAAGAAGVLNTAGTENVLAFLQNFDGLRVVDSAVEIGRYIANNLPPLKTLMLNYSDGPLGQSCAVVVILVGLYFIYRGYMHWQLPCFFLLSAYVSAMICPLIVHVAVQGASTAGTASGISSVSSTVGLMREYAVWFPISAGGWAAGFTYVNYQLFAGGLLFGAFILGADMTSRPIMRSGQVMFAIGAGVLTIILRLYSPIVTPCFVAILIMNTLRGGIDSVSRVGMRWLPKCKLLIF